MQRKRHSAEFKAKVALEVVKGVRTVAEIASEYGVHPNMLTKWKKQLLAGLPDVFSSPNKKENDNEELVSSLYKQIGQLTVEVDWLRKKSVMLQ